MGYQVDDDVLIKTTRCGDRFSCLLNGDKFLCKVEKDEGMIFIEPKDTTDCSYKMCFRNSFLCTCPTRREIYKLHNK